MEKIKFDLDVMRYIANFEKITRTSAKDCIISDDVLVFVIKEGELGKAIGKKAANLRSLERILKKKIRIVEYSGDLVQFVQKVIAPAKAANIEQKDNLVLIKPLDLQNRGYIIGRNAVHLRLTERILQRYFEVKEVKVI